MGQQTTCVSCSIPSQQRVFLRRVFVLLLHRARSVREAGPDRGIPGGLPPGPGPRQAQDLEEPVETLLPQTQEGRVRDPSCAFRQSCVYWHSIEAESCGTGGYLLHSLTIAGGNNSGLIDWRDQSKRSVCQYPGAESAKNKNEQKKR